MAKDLYGTSGADSLTGTAADEDIWAYGGADTINPGAGEDRVYGGLGDDTYIITDRWDLLYEAGGKDTALVYADFVKYAEGIENWVLQPGVKALPYWIDALVTEEAIYAQRWLEPGRSFYVSFPKEPPSYLTPNDRLGWLPLTDKQIGVVRTALQSIESMTGLKFQETDDLLQPNVIAFAMNRQTSSAAYAYYPDDAYWGSDLFFDDSRVNLDARTNSYFALTVMHEIGHTLGLKHPFDDSEVGESAVGPFLPFREENTKWTVMSYNEWPPYSLDLAPFDVAALQYLYGPNPSARAGDDRYIVNGDVNQIIWDGAGRDLLDASALNQTTHLSLEQGVWSWVGEEKGAFISDAGQLTININTKIEDLYGGSGNDWLHGNSLANEIRGGAGNDTIISAGGDDSLFGGQGQDWAMFDIPFDEVTLKNSWSGGGGPKDITRPVASYEIWEISKGEERVQLDGIERLRFSDVAVGLDVDGLTGDAYSLIAMVYGRSAISPEVIGLVIHLQDQGTRWDELVGLATASQAYVQRFGSFRPEDLGEIVWKNITGLSPDVAARDLIEQTQQSFSGNLPDWLGWLKSLAVVRNLIGLDEVGATGIFFAPWSD